MTALSHQNSTKKEFCSMFLEKLIGQTCVSHMHKKILGRVKKINTILLSKYTHQKAEHGTNFTHKGHNYF
jgi:hypothetical protein